MNGKTVIVLGAIGLVLALGISSLAAAVPVEKAGRAGTGMTAPDGTVVRIDKVVYYNIGGMPHPVTLSQTSPGPVYTVNGDTIIAATGYFKGPGGKGMVEVYNTNTIQNYVSKLIPSDKTVTATTPAAIWANSGTTIPLYALVVSPGGGKSVGGYFQLTWT